MVTTNADKVGNGRLGKRSRAAAADGSAADAPVAGGKQGGTPRADDSRAPAKVGATRSGRRIREIADVSESLDVRRRLRRLARQIQRGSHHVQHMNFIEGAIGDCLDEAAATAAAREQWLLCEAATWGLAWMARTRRAGGSAGGLLERLVKAARSAQAVLASGDTLPARFVLALSRLFRDIEACRCLESDAVTALTSEIDRLVSTSGVVGLSGSSAMVERVARWTAAREIALATGPMPWDASTEDRFAKAVTVTLRLLGGQGRMLVGAGRMPAAFSAPVLVAAIAAGRKRVQHTVDAMHRQARTGKEGKGSKLRGSKSDDKKLLPRDLHDASAGVAIIRSGWEANAVRVLLEYRSAVPHLEIAVGDRLLVAGPWQWRVTQGGRPLDMEGPWTLSCWESDRKATYLEIIAPLSGGLQIDRQIVVLPKDRVVLLADAITRRPSEQPHDEAQDLLRPHANGGAEHASGGLRMAAVLPLAPSLESESADETREILVYDTKPRLQVLPLALPEWKVAGRGSFASTADGLAIEQPVAGGRGYMPLWLDLDPARQGRPLTWRQLTVADTRQNLPPHQAIGFRVQEGLEQWLVYRTLDAARNRTVIGCNLSCGFVLGRIERTGMVDRTIEIQ